MAALGFLVFVVVGNRWRRSKHASHVNPHILSEKPASLVPDMESKAETDSSPEDYSYVWKQELFVARIALASGLICIPLVLGVQNWTQWIISTFP